MHETDRWFSTRVRLVCLIGENRASHQMDCVHVFRAAGWDAAFGRALELRGSHEEKYENEAGTLVRWKLAEIVSLDLLRTVDLDGAEVHSELVELGAGSNAPVEFAPERSRPTQTL